MSEGTGMLLILGIRLLVVFGIVLVVCLPLIRLLYEDFKDTVIGKFFSDLLIFILNIIALNNQKCNNIL